MKQEDKELLLKDLCARLPYGVKGMLCEDCICTLDKIWTKRGYESVVLTGDYYDVDCFKPYLFPLSSMTEEQEIEYDATFATIVYEDGIRDSTMTYKSFDWFNKNHFDYRGLIEKGLAIDATGLNIY